MHKLQPPALLRFLILTLATFLFLVSGGYAEEIQVGSKTLSIVPPEGYCVLDHNNPADAFVMDTVQKAQAGHGLVLMHFVLCTEFDDWHAGRAPGYSHYGNTSVQLQDGTPHTFRISLPEFIAEMQKHMPEIDMAEIEREVNGKVEGIELSGSQVLGVIGKDSNALYVGLASAVEVGGQRTLLAGVTSFTLLGSFIANTNLTAPAEPGAHERLLVTQKAYLAELVRLNP